MDGQTKNQTKEKTVLDSTAKEKITASQLIKELSPLVRDCFICEVVEGVHEINLKFLNGQKFILIAKEVSA